MTTPPGQSGADRFSVDLAGSTLLDTYRVERKLAHGGMGSIYLAEDTNLGRPVVVKVPHPRFLGEPEFRERFAREVAELVRLEHPHIVRILARGEHDGLPFFLLQYLGGGSLEDRIKESPDGRLSPPDLADWLLHTAETLDFVHGRGIVHRDVKPENILFDEEGHVFLSDFGVAKALESEDGAITGTGVGIGSPLHMAPEQGLAQQVGPAADQYGLASTVYQALAGKPPFGEDKSLQALLRKGSEDAPPLLDHAPDVPPEAAAAVMKALSRGPEDRFSTCAEFARAFLDGLAEKTTGTGTSVTQPIVVPPPHRRVGHLVVVVLAAVALVALGSWLFLRPGSEPTVTSTTPPADTADEKVVLVSPGAEPRQLLRYRLRADRRESVLMTTAVETRMKMGEQEINSPGKIPMSMGSDVVIDEVTEDGLARFRWIVSSCNAEAIAGMPSGGGEQAGKMFDRLIGFTVGAAINDRGLAIGEMEHETAASDDPMNKQFLDSMFQGVKQLATPLPAEPVGVGARWEVTVVVDQMGMRLTQTMTFELRSLEGTKATLGVAVAQTAPAQEVESSFLGTEADMRLVSFHGRGEGSIELDLTELVPSDSSIDITLDLQAEVTAEEETQTITMHFGLTTEMKRQ